jgi:hypothetical protein
MLEERERTAGREGCDEGGSDLEKQTGLPLGGGSALELRKCWGKSVPKQLVTLHLVLDRCSALAWIWKPVIQGFVEQLIRFGNPWRMR